MSPLSRRDFCRRAAQTALTLSVASPLAGLLACGTTYVNPPLDSYDAIFVGGGTAATIVAAKLRLATGGRKRILIIDAGGPTSATIGGAARPQWLPSNRSDLTIFDVPGEYSQIAYMPLGMPYQLTEVPFSFQAIGLGGNSMYNGMLFQTNPAAVFDSSWPSGWHWADMAPYFDRVRSECRLPALHRPTAFRRTPDRRTSFILFTLPTDGPRPTPACPIPVMGFTAAPMWQLKMEARWANLGLLRAGDAQRLSSLEPRNRVR